MLPPHLAPLAEAVTERLTTGMPGGAGRLGVAFSGGVDSSLLLALAVRSLGPSRVVGIIGVSPSLAEDERRNAHDVAAYIGAPVVEVATHEGDNPAYRANGPDRCFHCKDELFTRISDEVARVHGLEAVAYGENADDARRPDRPGSRAATEHGVLRPLADAGLSKADVRDLARALGLPNADKPAAPCLASRIPHFAVVDPAKLAQVEQLERAVRSLGFVDCRVRHHDQVARIELTEPDLERAMAAPVRDRAAARRHRRRLRLRRRRRRRHPVRRFHAAPRRGDRWLTTSRRGGALPEATDGVAELDLGRAARRGYPEAIYCEGKTPEQVGTIAERLRRATDDGTTSGVVLFTRAAADHARAVLAVLPDAAHDEAARLLAWPPEPQPPPADWLPSSAPARRTCPWPARPCSPRATSAAGPSSSSTSGWPGCIACSPGGD